MAGTVIAFFMAPMLSGLSPPFPSEETSLTTYGEGVVWSFDSEDFGGVQYYDLFSNVPFGIACIDHPEGSSDSLISYSSGSFSLSLAYFCDPAAFDCTLVVPSFNLSWEQTADGSVGSAFWIVVHDADASGSLNPGDSITVFSGKVLEGEVIEAGFEGDTEYAFAIKITPPAPSAYMLTEYRFGFHDDEFFTWQDSFLDWPW